MIAILAIAISAYFSFSETDEERFIECFNNSTFIEEDKRSEYCVNKIDKEDYNRAVIISGG